jgi:hypothetical protein
LSTNGPSSLRGRVLILLLSATLAAPVAAQTTWNVPNDVPTIQGAIAAASSGDTIEIEPGTYPEALESLGKNLTLVGLGGAAATIVDATGLGASVLRLESPTGGGTVSVRGLTLTGGTGTGSPPTTVGGGVFATAGSHMLEDCVIRNNTVAGTFAQGGGVWAGHLSGTGYGKVTLSGCELAFNSTEAVGGGAAGIVALIGCHVHHNVADAIGGGLYEVDSAQDCLIEANSAAYGGGAAYKPEVLHDCVFRVNHAELRGGGLFDNDTDALAGTDLSGHWFEGNTAGDSGGGAFLVAEGLSLTVERCTFAGNSAPFGDGLFVDIGTVAWPFGSFEVSRCTFVGDQLFDPGDDVLVVRNAIFRGHALPIDSALHDVLYCDVEGGYAGTGNIDADPLFVDEAGGDFALQPGSPCINAGDPSSPHDPDGSVAEMGAFTFHPWSSLGTALAGIKGLPLIAGHGPLTAGSTNDVALTKARQNVTAFLVVGLSPLEAPFKGGVLVPNPDVVVPVPTGALGSAVLPFTWPAAIPSGFTIFLQYWIPDPVGVQGFAATQGLKATAP